MSKKFKVGTNVVPTRACMNWYRNHIGEGYVVRSNLTINPSSIPEILLWAMSDTYTPAGVVIKGTPADEHTVRVALTSPFGHFVGYLDTDSLLKKRKTKLAPDTLPKDDISEEFCGECQGTCRWSSPKSKRDTA